MSKPHHFGMHWIMPPKYDYSCLDQTFDPDFKDLREEDKIQGEFFWLVWHNFEHLRWLFWHTPNGGKRSATEAGRLQAIGVVPGVADITLTGGKYKPICYIEFKDHKGKQGDYQKLFQSAANAAGFDYHIFRNVGSALKIFCEFYGV